MYARSKESFHNPTKVIQRGNEGAPQNLISAPLFDKKRRSHATIDHSRNMGTPLDHNVSYTDAIKTPGKTLPKIDSSDSIKAMNEILKEKLKNLEKAVPNIGGPMKPA